MLQRAICTAGVLCALIQRPRKLLHSAEGKERERREKGENGWRGFVALTVVCAHCEQYCAKNVLEHAQHISSGGRAKSCTQRSIETNSFTLSALFKITTSPGVWIHGSPSTCTGMSVFIRILIYGQTHGTVRSGREKASENISVYAIHTHKIYDTKLRVKLNYEIEARDRWTRSRTVQVN